VTIILNNKLTSATASEGPFTPSGGLNTSGYNKMVIGAFSKTLRFHCKTVLTNAKGSITIHLACQMIPVPNTPLAGGPGHWVVVSGIGAYANLRGRGTLTMAINFATGAAVETMPGFVFLDNDENEDQRD
jgi:hypothetical protein